MRGEICVGFASVLSAISLIILIFTHVAQINTDTVPRSIYLTRVNMTGYGNSVQKSIFNNVTGLYTNNASAPLQDRAGLRRLYSFGWYSYCAYVDDEAKEGTCSNHTAGMRFRPFDVITADMPENYSIFTSNFIDGDNTFRDSKYLGDNSRAAYWLLLIGTIAAVLALITGIAKNHLTFFVSTIFAVLGSIFLLASASLWTVMITKTQHINIEVNRVSKVPLEIYVTKGSALYLNWAAFVLLAVSVIPYTIICCTYRG